MTKCPACSDEVPEGRFCRSCGAPIDASEAPTWASPAGTRGVDSPAPPRRGATHGPTPTSGSTPWPSSDSLAGGRFLPGTMLAERYRVIGLLGKGGMGEVYRADDLKLGQPVALKFLPETLLEDESRLGRFFNEVRTARQVTHPSVCRVHDIGDVDGQHYISMEYVDGEDLATLLRRIGRLPEDKAVQIARQLCAGLAAAHDQGIVHRDLKPANIMIDGRGRARITDFGLASLAEQVERMEVRSGTPAFMAPEQLAGKGVSAKSDIYSLGLVLYELFTGKPAFKAKSAADLVRMQQETTPTSPASLISGFDPTVERVILRCLEKDPGERPASALAVAAALPGGDPLAAALAAGETPSPEMVADAGAVGGMRPAVGAILMLAILLGMAVVVVLFERVTLVGQVPLPTPPTELTLEARGILRMAGYEEPPTDSVHDFRQDTDYFRWVEDRDSTPTRWADLATVRPAPIAFWYRQSPRYLVPASSAGSVSSANPPARISGEAYVELDPGGRLLAFHVVPPQRDDATEPWPEPEWSGFLDAAGLDAAALTPADPQWAPLLSSDTAWAWEGAYPDQPDVPIRIEVRSYRGRPVYFDIVTPWDEPRRMNPFRPTRGQNVANVIILVLVFSVLIGGVLLARRNLRLGRGDRRGAFRLAFFVFVVGMLNWALIVDHVPAFAEVGMFFWSLAYMAMLGGFVWLLYVALEPYVRRLWPDALISWSRLIDGRFRDPLIGRDILIGGVSGIVLTCVGFLFALVPGWLGLAATRPASVVLSSLSGFRQAAASYFGVLLNAPLLPVFVLFLVLLLRILLRRQWAAVGGFVLIFTVAGAVAGNNPAIGALGAMVVSSLFIFVLIRFGLLAFLFMIAFQSWGQFVLTSDLSAWYAGRSVVALLAFAALAAYGFYISLAGRPLFKDALLPELEPQ